MSKTILVTGANRGIGLTFVQALLSQGMTIYACCRQPEKATELLKLQQKHPHLQLLPLDLTNEQSIANIASSLQGVALDWLINNAGIAGDTGVTVGNISAQNFLNVLHTNVIGQVQLSDQLLPNLEAGNDKLIITISSRMGSISDNDSGRSYAYRTSKAALNAVMRSFAIDVKSRDIKVMLFHPGWVQTDMGGEQASLSAEESVQGMLSVIDQHGHNAHAETVWRYDGDTIDW